MANATPLDLALEAAFDIDASCASIEYLWASQMEIAENRNSVSDILFKAMRGANEEQTQTIQEGLKHISTICYHYKG